MSEDNSDNNVSRREAIRTMGQKIMLGAMAGGTLGALVKSLSAKVPDKTASKEVQQDQATAIVADNAKTTALTAAAGVAAIVALEGLEASGRHAQAVDASRTNPGTLGKS